MDELRRAELRGEQRAVRAAYEVLRRHGVALEVAELLRDALPGQLDLWRLADWQTDEQAVS